MELYKSLLVGNKKWVRDRLERDPQYFQNLAKGRIRRHERKIHGWVYRLSTGLIKELRVDYNSSAKIPSIFRIKGKIAAPETQLAKI